MRDISFVFQSFSLLARCPLGFIQFIIVFMHVCDLYFWNQSKDYQLFTTEYVKKGKTLNDICVYLSN